MSDLDAYDYDLPRELIAQRPLPRRSDARLLVVRRDDRSLDHCHVRDLPEVLTPGDCLVLNDTRVIPARLVGHRVSTHGRWTGLFLDTDAAGNWRVLCKTRGRLMPGDEIALEDRNAREACRLVLLAKLGGGLWVARPVALRAVGSETQSTAETVGSETQPTAGTVGSETQPTARLQFHERTLEVLERVGRVPLPPYIRHGEMLDADRENYQTVFAEKPGAVAAPTAGLHFTTELLARLQTRGVPTCRITLHVGVGTFRPITVHRLEDHPMHAEWACLTADVAQRLLAVRACGGRIVAVGTTAVRTLETAARGGTLRAWEGATDLFIRPPFTFRAVDALLTNFHLPKSTLLILVRTFGGDELLRRAYEEAIRERYRFFSYGDAMLIL